MQANITRNTPGWLKTLRLVEFNCSFLEYRQARKHFLWDYLFILCWRFLRFSLGTEFRDTCIHINITKHKITIPKITFFIPIPHPSPFPSLSSILSPFSLYTYFSLSLISLHPFHMCSIVPLSSSYTFFPLLWSNTSLLVLTSESRHYLSFSCTLFPQVLRNFLCHTLPCLILCFSPFFLACPYLCPFPSVPHSSIFFLLSIFPLLHWHTRSSLLLLRVIFLFSSAFRQSPALFPSIHFVFKLCSFLV
jgi:hypothetical protein